MRPRGRRRGQAVVEFALVLPLLVFLIVALYDAAAVLFVRVAADHALSGALADAARRGPAAFAPEHLRAVVARSAMGATLAPDAVQVTRRRGPRAGWIHLVVELRFTRGTVSGAYFGGLGTVEQLIRHERLLPEEVVGP